MFDLHGIAPLSGFRRSEGFAAAPCWTASGGVAEPSLGSPWGQCCASIPGLASVAGAPGICKRRKRQKTYGNLRNCNGLGA